MPCAGVCGALDTGRCCADPAGETATTTDLRRMAQLVTTYHDLPLGAVDAAVIALAERLDDFDIAALDRRHFTIVRPAGNRTISLYP